jgi:DNA polymerase III alpha subunit
MSNIASIVPIGRHHTFDVEVDHPDHQFYLANGVLTSNSHAVAYSIASFQCAYLLTNHEEEWLSTCLDSSSGAKKARAIADVQRLGYKMASVDINNSADTWRVDKNEKKIYPSLKSCKSVGDAAVEELLRLRPFSSIEQMFYNADGSWRLSKFNKSAMAALVKVRALESIGCVGEGKLFTSYQALHNVIENNWNDLKKSLKRSPFEGKQNLYKLAESLKEMPEWSKSDLVSNQIDVFGALDVFTLISPKNLQNFIDDGIPSIDEFSESEDTIDTKEVCWFVSISSERELTKTGKTYQKLTVTGPAGKQMKIKLWPERGSTMQIHVPKFSVCLAQLEKSNWGLSTNSKEIMFLAEEVEE